MITATMFSGPISSKTSANLSKMNWPSLSEPVQSTARRKCVPLGVARQKIQQRSALYICPPIAQENKACDPLSVLEEGLKLVSDAAFG